VDVFLEDDVLWIHPKITNPTREALRGYWWTCVAHHATPNSRILAPGKAR
jgi:hypothetical protein